MLTACCRVNANLHAFVANETTTAGTSPVAMAATVAERPLIFLLVSNKDDPATRRR